MTARQHLNRTKVIETVGKTISSEQMNVHMVHTLSRKSQEERRQILHDALGKELALHIPEGQLNDPAIEKFLQKINVKIQAYHSESFVGNHVETCLKVLIQNKKTY